MIAGIFCGLNCYLRATIDSCAVHLMGAEHVWEPIVVPQQLIDWTMCRNCNSESVRDETKNADRCAGGRMHIMCRLRRYCLRSH